MTPPPAAIQATSTVPFEFPTAAPRVKHLWGTRIFDPACWSRLRFASDTLVLMLATVVAVFGPSTVHLSTGARLLGVAFPLLMLVMLCARESPDDQLSGSLVDTVATIAARASLAGMATLAAGSVLGLQHVLPLVLRLWVFAFVYLSVARATLRSLRRHALSMHAFATPTLIVGAGVVGDHLARRLAETPEYGLLPVGLIDSSPLPRPTWHSDVHVPVLGGPDSLLDSVVETGARRVIVAFSPGPDAEIVPQLEACRRRGIEVSLVPRMFELINDRSTLDHVGGLPLVTIRPTNPRSWQFAVKHVFDRVFAFLALVLLSPLMLAIAIAVRLETAGPILFRSRRVGRDGQPFEFYKFRSMYGDPTEDGEADAAWLAEQIAVQERGDDVDLHSVDRRTRVGKFLRTTSLDELPQLINVLRGEMSFVGPRPERLEYVERFRQGIDRYDSRHRVKAGITGWAQVCGLRGTTSIADRVEWDNYYIQNWSLGLDLRIIVLTIGEIARLRG